MLAAWLREKYPRSEVLVERDCATSHTRVPDVQIVGPGGQRVAFDIEYAALTVEEFATRTAFYAAEGVPVVWLWGHTGKHLRKGRPEYIEGAFKLNAVQEKARSLGMQLLWLNPALSKIGIAATTARYAAQEFRVQGDRGQFDLEIDELDELEVVVAGVTSPRLAKLEAGRAARQAQIEAFTVAARAAADALLAQQELRQKAARDRQADLVARRGAQQVTRRPPTRREVLES